jgi:hypothetical protein
MRYLELFMVLVAAIFICGCPPPESYVKSTELGLENAANLDKNIDILAKNYYTFIKQDTAKEVKAGNMTEADRGKVLEDVEKQMTNLKEQAVINTKVIALAHDYVHGSKLTIEDVLAGIKTVGRATPEILAFIEKLKGGN